LLAPKIFLKLFLNKRIMIKNRREFLKISGLTMAGMAAVKAEIIDHNHYFNTNKEENLMKNEISIIGQYGDWASKLKGNKLPKLSFRNKEFTNIKTWQKAAKTRTLERMGVPDIGPLPKVMVVEKLEYDGLHIEKLEWQLPYGRATEAVLLKPINAQGKLPAVLALHDHGGNKYFGTRKITKTADSQHPMMKTHQSEYYDGKAWANELAKKGYIVLVADSFAFASRRVMLQDVPEYNREGLNDNEPEKQENIDAYNHWAGQHGHVLAKSLFCAGTTWPGVFFAEDKKALDVLCARDDVDSQRVGCCGLSGGGLRSVYLGGLDARIKCAIPVGFMTTWNDFLLHKSFTHTWMTYVPMLPNELDFPEILGLRTPLPTLVLNDIDDSLYTIDEMKKADNILKEIYKKAQADSNYKCSFYPGPHKFDQKMQAEAFDWFDKWLKK
jgi:dienelactone hydrolase